MDATKIEKMRWCVEQYDKIDTDISRYQRWVDAFETKLMAGVSIHFASDSRATISPKGIDLDEVAMLLIQFAKSRIAKLREMQGGDSIEKAAKVMFDA